MVRDSVDFHTKCVFMGLFIDLLCIKHHGCVEKPLFPESGPFISALYPFSDDKALASNSLQTTLSMWLR